MTVAVVSLAVAAVLLWPAAWVGASGGGVDRVGDVGLQGHPAGRRWGQRHGPWSRRRRRRSRERLQADLAELVSLLAAPLRAGAVPGVALATVARTVSPGAELGPVLADLLDAAPTGAGLAGVWLAHADRLDSPDLRFVASAWQLTERTGAPLAEALVSAERVLAARRRARERVATVAAGPRSSMFVLAGLPCAGPVVGLAFGLTPAALYLSSPASLSSAAAGAVLGTGAWLWSRRIVSGALRSRTAAGGPAGGVP